MRTLITSFFLFVAIATMLAQAPQGINYQAVAREANGMPSQTPVTVTFTIFDNINGNLPLLFSETHQPVAPAPNTGLFNLKIGNANPTDFVNINWANGDKYLQVTVNNIPGPITQMLSVPYALYAKTAGNSTYTAGNGISISNGQISNIGDNDNSPTNEIQTLSLQGNQLFLTGSPSVTLPVDGDGSATNELQTLSINGNQLLISGTNSVQLPSGLDNQTLSISGNQLTISGSNSTVTLPPDADNNPMNELQNITLNGNQLVLSQNGGTVNLPSGLDNQTLSVSGNQLTISGSNSTVALPQDGDGNSSNEIQTISLAGNTLSLSNGGGQVNLPSTPNYSQGNGISISNNTISNTGDLSNTNELQTLSISGTTLTIAPSGNSVNLPAGSSYNAGSGITIINSTISALDPSPTNEIQSLSVAGNQLTISGSNTVTLPAGISVTSDCANYHMAGGYITTMRSPSIWQDINDPGNSQQPVQVTAPANGVYLVQAYLRCTDYTPDDKIYFYLQSLQNANIFTRSTVMCGFNSHEADRTSSTFAILNLSAGEILKLKVKVVPSATVNTNNVIFQDGNIALIRIK